MIFNRPCLALLVVGWCCTRLAAVEDPPPLDSGENSPGTGGTSERSPGTSDGGETPPGTNGKRKADTRDFRTGEMGLREQAPETIAGTDRTETTPGAGSTGATPGTGASSSFSPNLFSAGAGDYGLGGVIPFGSGQGGPDPGGASAFSKPKPTSYTIEGFYGQGRKTLNKGEGRLGKLHFHTYVSVSTGYDDNYESVPSGGAPVKVLNGIFDFIPGVPAGTPIIKDELVYLGGGLVGVRPVLVGFTKTDQPAQIIPHFDTVPPPERKSSFLTRGTLGVDLQRTTRHSFLTLATSGGASYYWNKAKDPLDYNGAVKGVLLYRFTPHLRVTESLDATYTTQPDLARLDTPTRPTVGPFLSINSRTDVKFRYTPRVSATGTVSYDAVRYTNSLEQVGDHNGVTLGLQAEYLWNPHYTLTTELRHNIISYPNQGTRDSATEFFLVGTDFTYSRRLDGSLRLGVTEKAVDGGDATMSPYVESTLNYRANSHSVLQWASRFGFEEPDAANEERRVLRTGLNYAYSFTPRLRGSLGVNLLQARTSTLGGTSSNIEELTYDSTAALDYTVNRHFSLNLSYSFTDVASDQELRSYYRNQIFFGGSYQF
jgi:hypothetical protein